MEDRSWDGLRDANGAVTGAVSHEWTEMMK